MQRPRRPSTRHHSTNIHPIPMRRWTRPTNHRRNRRPSKDHPLQLQPNPHPPTIQLPRHHSLKPRLRPLPTRRIMVRHRPTHPPRQRPRHRHLIPPRLHLSKSPRRLHIVHEYRHMRSLNLRQHHRNLQRPLHYRPRLPTKSGQHQSIRSVQFRQRQHPHQPRKRPQHQRSRHRSLHRAYRNATSKLSNSRRRYDSSRTVRIRWR